MSPQRSAPALVVAVLSFLPLCDSVAAQDEPGVPAPPFISRLDGTVTLTRNAVSEEALLNGPILDGDRLGTGAGRAALQWPDGTVLAADEHTLLDLIDAHTLRLRRGTVMLFAPAEGSEAPIRLSTSNARLEVVEAARVIVRTDTGGDRGETTRVDVEAGWARLVSDGGDLPVDAGQSAVVEGLDAPVFAAAGTRQSDAFRQWAQEAGAAIDVAAGSEYLPPDLAAFGPTLDRHGAWQYDPLEAWVWYPQVATTWQPYSVGVWVHAGYYGWFWTGQDPWAWPTHHYGRWGVNRHGRWYWRPDRKFAPAWVSWAVGPGYVSWCPLGSNGQPRVTPFVSGWNRHDPAVRRVGLDPWHGWTTVPSRVFGVATPVHRAAVDGRTLPDGDLRAFVTQRTPPPRARGAFSAVGSTPSGPGPASALEANRAAGRGDRGTGEAFGRTPEAASHGVRRSPGYGSEPHFGPGATREAGPHDARSPRPDHPAYRPDPYVTPRGDHPAYAPGPYAVPSGSPDHPVYAPDGRYDRATPFLDPSWTSRSRLPAGLPRIPEGRGTATPTYVPDGYERPGDANPDPSGRPRPTPYDRATPFLGPSWTSPSRLPAGLPRIPEGRGAATPAPAPAGDGGAAPGAVATPRRAGEAQGASPRAPSRSVPTRAPAGARPRG